jgi:hypothetical protein
MRSSNICISPHLPVDMATYEPLPERGFEEDHYSLYYISAGTDPLLQEESYDGQIAFSTSLFERRIMTGCSAPVDHRPIEKNDARVKGEKRARTNLDRSTTKDTVFECCKTLFTQSNWTDKPLMNIPFIPDVAPILPTNMSDEYDVDIGMLAADGTNLVDYGYGWHGIDPTPTEDQTNSAIRPCFREPSIDPTPTEDQTNSAIRPCFREPTPALNMLASCGHTAPAVTTLPMPGRGINQDYLEATPLEVAIPEGGIKQDSLEATPLQGNQNSRPHNPVMRHQATANSLSRKKPLGIAKHPRLGTNNFSKLVVARMVAYCTQHPYPSKEDKETLANFLGLQPEQVHGWFSHNRHKCIAKAPKL